ncbi:helix-turn-helix domain-containing protein [Neisseria yangbaofengii]|uniref:helix-turn-helix domain-containing protein n=1 Tax=Neisseria yangbaofengii TaxID=2709396 RepID=UPI0013ECFC3D|nr:helix-turn-helix transcriptional regulator [Neisseria yangbaofengii]
METHDKIRLMRELRQWSQEDVAEKLEMSAGGYAKVERGETQLSLPRLEQLAAVFRVDVWDLLKSAKGGLVLQINESVDNSEFSVYSRKDGSAEIELLKAELKYTQELLAQKDREIELLRKIAGMMESQQSE